LTELAITIFSADALKRSPQRGTRVSLSWSELVRWAASPSVGAAKDEHGGWSGATFAGDARAKRNVEHVFGLGLDIDDGTPFATIVAMLAHYTFFAHSTFSSTPTTPKTRAFVLYAEPLSADEHERVWMCVASHFSGQGVTVDRATRDASRVWFVPTIRAGADYAFHTSAGAPLDGKAAARWEPPRPAPKQVDASTISDAYLRGALRRAHDAVASATNGARNAVLNREAYAILRLPIDAATARDVLVSAAVHAGLSRREAERTYDSAAKAREVNR